MGKNIRIISLACSLFMNSAQSMIIDNGLTTIDSDTGLEWLDVTETVNISYNDVTTLLADFNSALYGYRYATRFEVTTLIDNWVGYATSGSIDLMVGDESLDPLVTMLGSTYEMFEPNTDSLYGGGGIDGNGLHYTWGLTASLFYNSNEYISSRIYDQPESYTNTFDSYREIYASFTTTDSYGWLGSYLVKDAEVSPVPIPATIWLFGFGLLALVGVSKHKQSPIS